MKQLIKLAALTSVLLAGSAVASDNAPTRYAQLIVNASMESTGLYSGAESIDFHRIEVVVAVNTEI